MLNTVKSSNYIVVTGWMINELNLSGAELMIYAVIYGFSQDGMSRFDGSIQYLADWANASKRHAIRCLNQLEEKGLIEKHEHVVHGIKVNSYSAVLSVTPDDKMSPPPMTKCHHPDDKMSPNNLVDTLVDIQEETNKEDAIPYKEIIDHLNMRLGTQYKANSQKTRELIHARFAQGFTLEDFKTVIDKKAVEWINDSRMSKFLRPDTLFSNKFEGYLNQIVKKPTLKDAPIDVNMDEFMDFEG